jgi:hypothetical protein
MVKKNVYTGGALCSLVKTKPLAILHLFMVPCKEIKNNDAFYQKIIDHHINYVQLSPLQECRLKEETHEVLKDDIKKWYLTYQPKSNELGNQLHGNKDDIKEAIAKFNSYKINVIADVVLGHLESNINYKDNNEKGIKYFNDDGLEALLIMADLHLPYEKIIHLDENINALKYTLYDMFVNLEKNYGKDFLELTRHKCGINKNSLLKHILNNCFRQYDTSRSDNLLTQDEVIQIYEDLIKFRDQIKIKICKYLKINESEFKNEYYDIITVPYKNETINQLKWLVGLSKLNHDNKLVQQKTFEYLKELADIGVCGLRFDYAIGFDPYILARYVEYFYRCVPESQKDKIFIYHEIIYYGHELKFRDNQQNSNLYKEELYRTNTNYKYSWNNNKREVSITSYENLYKTRGSILSNNIHGLNGMNKDDIHDVVFSETHDTIFNKPFVQLDENDWYNHIHQYGQETNVPLSVEKRIELSMLMLCYFLSRACRIPLIYLNQINFDGIFNQASISHEYYEKYKPTEKSHDNVLKCLQFRNSLIVNKVGNEEDEFDSYHESLYISTKFIGSRKELVSIYINFTDSDIFVQKDNITVEKKSVFVKCEELQNVCKALGIRIDN